MGMSARGMNLDRTEARGRADRLAGVAEEACPYRDLRTSRGAVTFSRAYRRAWLRGWREGDKIAAVIGHHPVKHPQAGSGSGER